MRHRLALIISVFLFASIMHIEAKSTMEMLINKEWYEIDLSKMQTRHDFYIKFTGTQRFTVGADEDGNTKARVQSYYLSNEKTDIFDDTKVGKRRNGKYIVLQGKKHGSYTDAVCMELYQLDDMNMRMGNSRQGVAQQHCYVVDSKYADLTDNDPSDDGTIISTRDLLIDKMWYEVDLKTGKRKRTEVRYEKDGMALFCTMAENYKSELPDWQMREFYFSDNIEREFKHSKIGDRVNGIYLVVKERGTDGKWFAANYDISTLSANRLVLDCVYPQGMPTRVFMTRSDIETSHRNIQKAQQWQLTENVWHRLDSTGTSRILFTEKFDNINVTRTFSAIKNGVRDTFELSNPYYFSNTEDSIFNFDKVGKATEGDFIVVNERTTGEGRMAVSYKVDYLDNKNMLLSAMLDSVEHVIAYERDLSQEEQERVLADRQDSIKGKTTLDRLSGRQWRFAKKPYPTMSKWHRWYFTDSLWADVDFVYDEFKKVWNTTIKTQPFYLSDFAHHNFSMDELDKKYEGGRFINFYRDIIRLMKIKSPAVKLYSSEEGATYYYPRSPSLRVSDRICYSYELRYLTDWVLVYRPTGSVRASSFTLVSD